MLRSCIDARSAGVNVLTTLGGDFLAPSLLSSIDHGRGMVAAMNAIPVHAVCFGNHECDVPFGSLVHRIHEYSGTWLNSNMPSMLEEPALEGKLVEHHLVELEGGRSVVLTGFLVGGGKHSNLYRRGAFKGHAEKITPVLEAVPLVLPRVREAYPDADCVIPLTHQDMVDDVSMAEQGFFPLILGGHDHEAYCEEHQGVHIVKAGADAVNVAVVDLTWPAGAAWPSPPEVTVELVPLAPSPARSTLYEAEATVAEKVELVQRPAVELQMATLASMPLAELSSVGVRFHECSMATLLASGLRDVGGGDGALMNAGSIRGEKEYLDGKIGFADLMKELLFECDLDVDHV